MTRFYCCKEYLEYFIDDSGWEWPEGIKFCPFCGSKIHE